eukprot:6064941-Amphidinium_carterae.1
MEMNGTLEQDLRSSTLYNLSNLCFGEHVVSAVSLSLGFVRGHFGTQCETSRDPSSQPGLVTPQILRPGALGF